MKDELSGPRFPCLVGITRSTSLSYVWCEWDANHTKLTLEQHGFGLCRFTCMWIFFNKYAVSSPYAGVSHPRIQPTADQKQGFQSTHAESQLKFICRFSTVWGSVPLTPCCSKVNYIVLSRVLGISTKHQLKTQLIFLSKYSGDDKYITT